MRILLVEDDEEIADLLMRLLERNGYIVDHETEISVAREALLSYAYAIVILDRNLPDGDGLNLIEYMRKKRPVEELPPFIVLSAIGEVPERVAGLDAGAIDYIVKPYDPEELLARIRVCLTLKAKTKTSIVEIGNVSYDLSSRKAVIDGQDIELRRRELAIFDLLIRHRERVISHDELESAVYGYEDISSNTLAVQMFRLRKALETSGANITIRVLRNIGYKIETKTTHP